MRVMKFKAKNKKTNEIVYPDLASEPQIRVDQDGIIYENGKPTFDWDILLYTGRSDKNKRDIYEGDTLRWWFNETIYIEEVYWSEIDCGFRAKLINHNGQWNEQEYPEYDNQEEYYQGVINNCQRMSIDGDRWTEIIGDKNELL